MPFKKALVQSEMQTASSRNLNPSQQVDLFFFLIKYLIDNSKIEITKFWMNF